MSASRGPRARVTVQLSALTGAFRHRDSEPQPQHARWTRALRDARRLRQPASLVLVALVIIVASVPAWTGGPVYDDWVMRDSEDMRSLMDVAHAFRRTSADYFRRLEQSPVGGVTYRPLAHASLIATQAMGGSLLAHHLVSLALHLTSFVALLRALQRRSLAAGSALLLASCWALHPVHVEAYGWVNGRADVLAGALVAALALVLAREGGALRELAAALCAAGAVLSKETAAFAVAAVLVASQLPDQGMPVRTELRRAARGAVGTCTGVLLAIGLRAGLVGLADSGVSALRAEPHLLQGLVRLFGEAAQHVLIPLPRAMACLAWTLAQPLSVSVSLLLVAGALGLGYLALQRRWRALVLLLGAWVTLAPAVMVGSAFWCGFDRYLYMPTVLAVLAWPERRREAPGAEHLLRVPRVFLRRGAVALAATLALATWATSQNYHSQSAFMASMIRLRPEDPSGRLFGAQWLSVGGKRAQALELLAPVPREGLPRPLASALVTRLAALRQREQALVVLDDMSARYPDDPYALLDVVWTSIQRGDLARVRAAAGRLRAEPAFCEGVRKLLDRGMHRPEIDRAELARFRATYLCGP